MNRRQLIKSCMGLAVLAKLQPATANTGETPYTREIFEQALADGKPFMLDFTASW